VTKIRAADNAVLGTFPAGDGPYLLTSVGDSIWVTNFNSDSITKLRASDGVNLSVTNVGANPWGVAFDGANIWVTNHGTNTVTIVEALVALQLPGLIGHWRGEGNALDSVGPNHGTLQGNVTYTAGKVGQGFKFQDYSQEKVYIDSQVYEMSGGTTSLWFNWDVNQSVASANVMIGSSLGGVRRSPIFDIDTGFGGVTLNNVGGWAFRPEAATKVPNLYLAGDYCRSHIDLVSMEGAFTTGLHAAEAVRRDTPALANTSSVQIRIPEDISPLWWFVWLAGLPIAGVAKAIALLRGDR